MPWYDSPSFFLLIVEQRLLGQIFSIDPSAPEKWVPSTLEEAERSTLRRDLWDKFCPGDNFFGNVPHGCISM